MPLLEAIRLALRTIRAQKLKSFFSLVGVLIGVTFLIAVVSIVQGMNRYMVDRFANTLVGVNTFELRQRPSINMGHITHETWLAWLRRPRISYADADFVSERIRTPATFAQLLLRTACRSITTARWPRTWTWSAPRTPTSGSGTTSWSPAGPSPRRRSVRGSRCW